MFLLQWKNSDGSWETIQEVACRVEAAKLLQEKDTRIWDSFLKLTVCWVD